MTSLILRPVIHVKALRYRLIIFGLLHERRLLTVDHVHVYQRQMTHAFEQGFNLDLSRGDEVQKACQALIGILGDVSSLLGVDPVPLES